MVDLTRFFQVIISLLSVPVPVLGFSFLTMFFGFFFMKVLWYFVKKFLSMDPGRSSRRGSSRKEGREE